MFGALGTVAFEVIDSPQRMRASWKYVYKVLAVISGKPAVQWIYDDLEKVSLEFVFHKEFVDPQTAEDALRAIADAHEIVPFVLGNGNHEGEFIIVSLKRKDIWRADDGTAIAINMTAELLEWSGTLPQGAPTNVPTSTPGLFANGQPQTSLYAGVNAVPPQQIPQAPAGMPSNQVDSTVPMFPSYPVLPFVPKIGQWSQGSGFMSVSLAAATRWGF